MAGNRRRKPLVSYEFGTRVYAPSEGEGRYRVVATDADGRRVFHKYSSEESARRKARDLEAMLASSVVLPGRAQEPATVGGLIDRYLSSLGSRSTRYVERQEYLLRVWVRPVLGELAVPSWTPSDSEAVLDRARRSLAPSTVQNVGSAMRALVTFAFKNRWLPREADPMWMVRYSPTAEVQGQTLGFVERSTLPTDEDCNRLFTALESADHRQWSLAMRLKHRSGVRWGELIALRPFDLDFHGNRVVRIHRAVEQSRQGLRVKSTKNQQRRVSTFPSSLAGALHEWADVIERRHGPHDLRHVAACWLLFDVGLDPAVVSALLGHANAAFTLSRYVGVRGDLSKTVTAATECW